MTKRSGWLAGGVATTVETGPTPPESRGPGTKVKRSLTSLLIKMDTSLDPLVGDDQVEPAVAGQVGDRDPHGIGAGEVAVPPLSAGPNSPFPSPG